MANERDKETIRPPAHETASDEHIKWLRQLGGSILARANELEDAKRRRETRV